MARERVEKNITRDTVTKKYHVTLYFGKKGGESQRRNKTVKTLKEAHDLLKSHKKSLETKQTSYDFSETTLLDCIEAYIQKSDLEETTEYTYRNFLQHIKSEKIAEIPISKLKYSDIEAYKKNIKRSTNLSKATINKHLTLIKSALNLVEKDDNDILIPVIRKMEFFKVKNNFKGDFYTEEECRKLLDCLDKSNDYRLKTATYIALMCGLRRGEICGLKWSNIDFKNNKISIKESTTQAGGKTINKGTKTESSNRDVFMPEIVKTVLSEYKKIQKNNSDFLKDDYRNKDFVYMLVNEFGVPVRPNYISQLWKEFLEKNGLRHIRFHDLRHTFVSTGYNNGASLLGIASTVGHSSTKMTAQVYTHLKKESNFEIGKLVSNAILSKD